MPKFKDLSGQTYGQILILHRMGLTNNKDITYWCRCTCTKEFECAGKSIKSGNTKSCGCLVSTITTQRSTKHGAAQRGKIHPIYRSYNHMLDRCYNPNNKDYTLYGGRGITVFELWKTTFINFFNWALTNGWKKGLSIDRKDTNKNYTPENCRWVTQKIQCNNSNKNIYITYNNKTQTIAQWSDELNLPYSCIYDRYARNLPIEKILSPNHFYNIKKENNIK